MYRLLRAKNRGLEPAVIDFAKQLVQTPSISLHERQVAEQVERQMTTMGYDTVCRDDVGNVVGVIHGRDAAPTALLCTHMDTVPPGNREPWERDPFSGHIENGTLYGRGAADCKGGLAAQLFAGALLKRSLLPLNGTLIVAATIAEQNGLGLGVRPLLKETLPELGLQPDFAILGEPTNLGLYYGHDGWLETHIDVEGTDPFHVHNAARAIFKDLETTCQWRSQATNGRQDIAVYSPRFREESDGLRRATVRMDKRLQGAEDVEVILNDVNHNVSRVAQGEGAVAVKTAVRSQRQRLYTGKTTVVRRVTNAWQTDPFHPFIEKTRRALAAAGCEAVPAKWELSRLGMGTAGGVMVNEFDIPTVGYGPGRESIAHEPNECVSLDKITECVYGTAAAVHGLIGVPVFGWTSDEEI